MPKELAVAEVVAVVAVAVETGIAVVATGRKDVVWGVVQTERHHNGREGVVLVDVPREGVKRQTPN